MDTIFALASGSGKAGVSVIRLSGPRALEISASFGADVKDHDRRLCRLVDAGGVLIDEAFVISFAPGRSFTGEQVVEFQTHGSPAIVRSVLNRLQSLGGREADAGEFTRRAMESGVLDLARVEGLADLIDAETESQRLQAVKVFKGDLGKLVENWRTKLVRAAALLEATIDFVDEDVPVDVLPEVGDLLTSVYSEIEAEASGVAVRERLRDGFEVALIGPPNAGKSTLLNRLAGRDAALTSDIAGTTRDVIEVQMDLSGLPVTILDTAGIRDSEDVLEGLGIQKGLERARNSDIRVHLSPEGEFAELRDATGLDLFVRTKIDLKPSTRDLAISALTGEGIEQLLSLIVDHLKGKLASAGVATRRRHQSALLDAQQKISFVLEKLSDEYFPVDLLAEDLRLSIRALDALIGRVDVENLLDEIFSSFCIGK